jgi:polar amino acid transport system substrate-binding protein
MVYVRQRLPDASLDHLRGLRVGVIRGWSYGDPFDQARQLREFQVDEVERDVQNFEKLRLGRLDAVLATEAAGELLLRLPRFQSLQVMPRPLWVFGIHLAFARSPSRRDLLQAFDREIAAMQQSGEWALLVQRESEAARSELEAELKRLPPEAKPRP